MPSVAVNAPKTPVTKGSGGLAAATLPNVCKMPGPPAPFVPTPLPNIGTSDNSPQGYSTTVEIEGNPVAIQGASFLSKGDVAAQGTGGGLISSNVQGATTFLGPGSFDVKIEGKNVQLLGDPMLNNCGPGGSPANAATMAGVVQGPLVEEAEALGIFAEVQHICDVKCACQEKGMGQTCISTVLAAEDAISEYKSPIKPEVPYNMSPPGGGPPTPYMSANDPRRATTRWWIAGSRRPDAIVPVDVSKPWSGDNIKALIEVKLQDDPWRDGQKQAYEKIAGGEDKLVEINDDNCRCVDDGGPEPVPVPVSSPQDDSTDSVSTTGVLGGLAVAAAAVALVAGVVTAPAWVPAAAGGAALAAGAAAVFTLFSAPSTEGSEA